MRGGMSMSQTYRNLNELLQSEEAARTFFMKQPEHIQGGVLQQAFAIHSLRSLEESARSLRYTAE